jgi:FtsP/CotA-like multicopper oxidase with cupredoxin domain
MTVQFPIRPGGNFTYKFSAKDEYGFYWYHSHVRAYYNDAIRGPLMIRPNPSRTRPFEKLAVNNADSSALLQAERDATSVLLNDWTHDLSDTVFARYFETGAFPHCVDSILANGYERVQCLPEEILQAGTGLGIGATPSDTMNSMSPTSTFISTSTVGSILMSGVKRGMTMTMANSEVMVMGNTAHSGASSTISSMVMSETSQAMGTLSPRGCMAPMMFRDGYNINSLPAETCTNTASTLLTIPVNPAQGWLALNLVNSGAVSSLRVSLDGHSMFVYAADGLFVTLQEVKASQVEETCLWILISLGSPPGNRSTILGDD